MLTRFMSRPIFQYAWVVKDLDAAAGRADARGQPALERALSILFR